MIRPKVGSTKAVKYNRSCTPKQNSKFQNRWPRISFITFEPFTQMPLTRMETTEGFRGKRKISLQKGVLFFFLCLRKRTGGAMSPSLHSLKEGCTNLIHIKPRERDFHGGILYLMCQMYTTRVRELAWSHRMSFPKGHLEKALGFQQQEFVGDLATRKPGACWGAD